MSNCRSVGMLCYIQYNDIFRGFIKIFNLNLSDFQFYRCSKSFVDQPTVSSVFVESFSEKHLPQVFFTKINQIISLIIRIHARGLTFNVVFYFFVFFFQRFEQKTGVQKFFTVFSLSFFSPADSFEICPVSFNNKNKTISDGGITVDFWFIKVHTSN